MVFTTVVTYCYCLFARRFLPVTILVATCYFFKGPSSFLLFTDQITVLETAATPIFWCCRKVCHVKSLPGDQRVSMAPDVAEQLIKDGYGVPGLSLELRQRVILR